MSKTQNREHQERNAGLLFEGIKYCPWPLKIKTNKMKRILRILVGLPLCPVLMFLATYIWLFTEGETWFETVGRHVWHLATGDWNKLPE